jgi:hypothetical protein
VAGVCVLALLAGIVIAYRISFPPKLESRRYEVGVATSRILVDTPSSQVVEVAPKGFDTLGTRAGLIASLMVDGPIKASIARRAGVRPEQIDGLSDSAAEDTAAEKSPGRRSDVLMTSVVTNSSGGELPLIGIEAHAANPAAAARLAGAAVSGLRDYLNSKAALQKIPEARRLQVTGLGAPQARDVGRGPRRLFALAAAVFVLAAGCAAIVVFSSLASAWRAAAEDEAAAQHHPAGQSHRAARNGSGDGHGALTMSRLGPTDAP